MKQLFSQTSRPALRAAGRRLATGAILFSVTVAAYGQQASPVQPAKDAPAPTPLSAADQEGQAKLNAMLAERAQEDEAAKQRQADANAHTKQHIADKKKKAKKK